MFLLAVPVLLAGPLLLLAAALLGLWAHGPLGWVASVGLLVGLWTGTRWCAPRLWTWWRGTKAPDLDILPARRVRHNG